jgi:hypothetical protein
LSLHESSRSSVAIAAALGLAMIPGADHAWAAEGLGQLGPVLLARYRSDARKLWLSLDLHY